MNKIERISLIKSLRKEGKTYQEIGTLLGVSRQRIHQLCITYGIEQVEKIKKVPLTYTERLQLRIKKYSVVNEETGCWDWSKSKTKAGYGRLSLKGHGDYAHRGAYVAFNGQIDTGLEVCHTCHNRACVNPDHLILGTHQENIEQRDKRKSIVKYGKVLTPSS